MRHAAKQLWRLGKPQGLRQWGIDRRMRYRPRKRKEEFRHRESEQEVARHGADHLMESAKNRGSGFS